MLAMPFIGRVRRQRTRRVLLGFRMALCLVLGSLPMPGQAATSSAVATFDWTIAETLLALDVSPVAMGNVAPFHRWTGENYADTRIINLGIQSLPNLELLGQLMPESALLPPRHRPYRRRLRGISNGILLDSYPYQGKPGDTWNGLIAFTKALGRIVDKEREAQGLIDDAEKRLASLSGRLDSVQPLMVVQLLDERHLRVYGKNSLFQAVLDQLDLKNAWQEATNDWGYAVIQIKTLFEFPDAMLVIIPGAFPVGIEDRLENSVIWNRVPSIERGRAVVLPSSFWLAGGLPSAMRFAESLVDGLSADDVRSAEPQAGGCEDCQFHR